MNIYTIGIGLVGGIMSGLFGIGGGIVLVPLMVFFLGLTQHQAQGTSIGALLLPVGIFAAWRYYQAGNLDVRLSLTLAITLPIGAYLGAILAESMPEQILRKVFGVFLVGVAAKFLFS